MFYVDSEQNMNNNMNNIENGSVDDEIVLNMEACFTTFDKDSDGLLSLDEFTLLCQTLFRNAEGHNYIVSVEQLREMFAAFDKNQDEFIDRDEFEFCWKHWIRTIMRPRSALLVVDVQNDFISGSLSISNCSAKHNGNDIIEPINRILDDIDFDTVFYSFDWHPSDHISFIDNIKLRSLHETSSIDAESAKVYDTVLFDGEIPMRQCLWPRHCVQDTWGAELHKDLKIIENSIKVYKGTNPDVDSYSMFRDNQKIAETTLGAQLRARGITDIYVCGIAYDVCVGDTAIDSISSGYRTILVEDCCRGIDLENIEKVSKTITSLGGVIISSEQINAMVAGADRRPELGYKLALDLNNEKSELYRRTIL